jgi:DNA-binding transcriptional LysR family regulator
MVLDELLIFTKVVEAGSFTAAAKKLGLPKSTVSQKVARLEVRLGVRLLHRSTRQVRPTEIGAAYHDRCARSLAEIEEAELALTHAQQLPQGLIRMTAPVEFSMNYLGPLIAEFVGLYPQVQIDIEVTSRVVDLIEEGVDLAVRANPGPASSLISRKLLMMEKRLYCSPAYQGSRGQPREPADLKRHSCLSFPSEGRPAEWTLSSATGKMTLPVSGSVRANNFTVLRDAAIAGAGIALLPSYLCRDAIHHRQLVLVVPEWKPEDVPFCLVYPTRRYLSSRLRAFIDFAAERLSSHQHEMRA